MKIQYSPMKKTAMEFYEGIKAFKEMIEDAEKSGEKLGMESEEYLRMFCKEAYRIPLEIRDQLGGLNSDLESMVDKGYLTLNDNEIRLEDPVGKRFYFKRMMDGIVDAIRERSRLEERKYPQN